MNNDDKFNDRQSILGELESIKDFLIEPDNDDIPLLQDTVEVDRSPQSSDADNIPLLRDFLAHPQRPEAKETERNAEEQPELSLDTEPQLFLDTEPELSIDEELLQELQQASDTISEVYNAYRQQSADAPQPIDTDHSEDGEWDLEFEGQNFEDQENPDLHSPLQDETLTSGDEQLSVSGTEAVTADSTDDMDEDVALALSTYESLFEEVGVDISDTIGQQLNDAFDAGQPGTTDQLLSDAFQAESDIETPIVTPTEETPTEFHPEEHIVTQSEGHSETDADQTAVDPAAITDELPLPPGVLPGQQSLFEDQPAKQPATPAPAPESASASGEKLSSSAAQTPAKPAGTSQQPSAARTDLKQVKARGENPFLPKHIRDRLHTNKPLVDIINEGFAPPPAAASAARVPAADSNRTPPAAGSTSPLPADMNQLVDELVAEYLPKIERTLRSRLEALLVETTRSGHNPLK